MLVPFTWPIKRSLRRSRSSVDVEEEEEEVEEEEEEEGKGRMMLARRVDGERREMSEHLASEPYLAVRVGARDLRTPPTLLSQRTAQHASHTFPIYVTKPKSLWTAYNFLYSCRPTRTRGRRLTMRPTASTSATAWCSAVALPPKR